MALSGSSLSSSLFASVSARGTPTTELKKLTDAIGNGIVLSLVGKSFVTTDVGTTPGAGKGSGTGLIVVPGSIAPLIVTNAVAAFGGSGPDLPLLALDIETATIQTLLSASLTSTHTPVFTGSGIINPGSIPVSPNEIGGNIKTQGISQGLVGPDFPGLADAIGTAVATALALASGSILITPVTPGAPTVPGVGVGQGIIS